MNPQTKVYHNDMNKVYWVICEDKEENRAFFKDLEEKLRALFIQDSVLIYYTKVSTI